MDEAVFIAQYTFLATPAVIEEESRILGKIARRLRCEYVIRFEDDGKFYFLLETRSGYEEHFARCGWYVVSQTDFNSRLTIGMGLYESGNLAGFMYRLDSGSEDEARFWNNILVFTFFNGFRKAFLPLDNRFQGFFRLDGSLCLYLYDYCPVRRNDKITFEGKKVSNAVWRFKSGEQTDLFVKLFSPHSGDSGEQAPCRAGSRPGIHTGEAPHPVRGVLPQALGGNGGCRRVRGDNRRL